MLLLIHTAFIGIHSSLFMNLRIELDNMYSLYVAKIIIALHRHRRVTALIPAGVPAVTLVATGLDLV